jgi:hypothetical protein
VTSSFPSSASLIVAGDAELARASPAVRSGAVGKEGSMFEAADIREWRGHDVVDAQGHKIGELEAVYVDTGTDQPSFGTAGVGMPTRHRLVFVPLDQAAVGPEYLRVCYDKSK